MTTGLRRGVVKRAGGGGQLNDVRSIEIIEQYLLTLLVAAQRLVLRRGSEVTKHS